MSHALASASRRHRRLTAVAALAVATAAVALATTAGATTTATGPAFGVAEDASKYADDGGARVYADLRDLGMTVNRWTARFTGDAGVIAEQAFLDRAVPVAQANGIRIVLSLFPASAQAPDPTAFCDWAANVARRYPSIREFIVGNEVNATRFWSPQHTEADADAGPRSYYAVLSACYDRLKAVDAGIRVIGMGLAPRAVDKNSTKPLDFVRTVGRIYKESRRTTPIMDAIAIHPYPNPNASPPPAPERAAYDDPGFFGLPQLDRVKQAVYDAFQGTAQPTTAGGLGIVIDEIGYQTETSGSSEYSDDESSPVVADDDQATYHAKVVSMAACDAAVTDVLFFHLIDESQRRADATSGGWQSGLERPSGARKPSYAAVKTAIGAGCTGTPVSWEPPAPDSPPTTSSETNDPSVLLARALESLPAFTTDGVGNDLVGPPYAELSGRSLLEQILDLAQRLQTRHNLAMVWPFGFASTDTLYLTVVVFVVPLCNPAVSGCTVTSTQALIKAITTIKVVKPRNKPSADVCSDDSQGMDCSTRILQASLGRRARMLVAATGTARGGPNGRVRIPLRVLRRGPGVYIPVVAVRSATNPSKVALVKLRPVVVATKAPLARKKS